MSVATSTQFRAPEQVAGDGERRQEVTARTENGGGVPLWAVVGLAAAVGLGAFAWYQFGPDLRRYLKIRSM
jgi:hypothetical protein